MRLTKRRFITISACCAASGMAAVTSPKLAMAALPAYKEPYYWQGIALGANASLTLYHEDSKISAALTRQCFQEISRLEKIFSLYQDDSSIVTLNKQGYLNNPPVELVELIEKSLDYGRITEGAFDITVQPLWELYSKHFSASKNIVTGPNESEILHALSYVNYQNIIIRKNKIAFTKSGMEITLNGIAQGYITDAVTSILQRNGFKNILVNMGETRALGGHPNGDKWLSGIKSPINEKETIDNVRLENNALATSGGYGTVFDANGKYHHLFNPKNGSSNNHYASVSVIAASATEADALSTAFSALEKSKIQDIISQKKDVSALISRDGKDSFWLT